ncbi:MAG TPA: L-threonylcarbamoyladenylate synthase [Burkholderiales bacterium]|nr:L-threonylcarbamoyladenylate synthase [Burkholderiales bacterium]
MAKLLAIHTTHPQRRLLRQAADAVRAGGLIAYPTDSCYALGCRLEDAQALERLRRVRDLGERHHLTLMCRDLSEISTYAIVEDAHYRLLKAAIPGSYTFILRARREVPKRVMHARRRTVGVRVPAHPVAHGLLDELDAPILSATLLLPGDALPLSDAEDIRDRLDHALDLVIDAGSCGTEPSTVIDLSGAEPVLVRAGKGSLEPFSLQGV